MLYRASIRVLVKDSIKTRDAYGPYVFPIRSDTSDPNTMRRALKDTGSVVCLGKLGGLPEVGREKRVYGVRGGLGLVSVHFTWQHRCAEKSMGVSPETCVFCSF